MATTRVILTPESCNNMTCGLSTISTTEFRPVLAFDPTTDEYAVWTFIAPQGITNTLSAVLSLAGGAALAAATYWEVSLEAVTSGDSADLDSTTLYWGSVNTGNVTMSATQGIMVQLSITLTNADNITAGDLCRLKVSRDANHASDTFSGDAHLLAVEIREA